MFPGGARLGFSPNVNGVAEGPEGSQGLNISSIDQSIDPVKRLPDRSDRRALLADVGRAPEHVDERGRSRRGERRVITGIGDLESLIEQGLVTDFVGNEGPENAFIAGLMPANAIINCPVLLQPEESAIGTTFGQHANL